MKQVHTLFSKSDEDGKHGLMRTGAVEERKEAKARSFAHALIAGVAKAPLKVTKKMGKKKVHFVGQILVQLVSMYGYIR